MKTYKYTDETNTVVHIIDEDGKSRGSCLVSVLETDSIIEAADPIPKEQVEKEEREALIQTKMRELAEAALKAEGKI